MRNWLLMLVCVLLAACASPATQQGEAFEVWALNQTEEAGQTLWGLLGGAGAVAGNRVRLQQHATGSARATLYQGHQAVAEIDLQARWVDAELQLWHSEFSGLPPLAWGRIAREVDLRIEADDVHVVLHESSFGMFLIIAGGAPDRQVIYRFPRMEPPR